MRALIAGWFSFPWMGATAGDLLAADVVRSWLDDAGCPNDTAIAHTLGGDLDALGVDPEHYTHLVFVCGPLGAGEPATTLFERFAHARRIGVDLSMLQPLEEWNPFHLLLERDSNRVARPDLALLADVSDVPVVALVLAHEQKEYAAGRHRSVDEVVRTALAQMPVAVVPVDTCFDPPNSTGLQNPAQVISVLGRADVIVSTRLHGLVLGLKTGVPVVAIDPVAGGAKVARQAAVLGWPELLLPDDVSVASVTAAVLRCLDVAARDRARSCVAQAVQELASVRESLCGEFTRG